MAFCTSSSSPPLLNQSTFFQSISPFPHNPSSSNTYSYRTINLKNSPTCSSYQTTEITNNPNSTPKKKKKQKPKPSFYEQVREKWSLKIDSQRRKFPWQEQQYQKEEDKVEEEEEKVEENVETPLVSLSLNSHFSVPPWVNRSNLINPQFEYDGDDKRPDFSSNFDEFDGEKRQLEKITEVVSKSLNLYSEIDEISSVVSDSDENLELETVFEQESLFLEYGNSDFREGMRDDSDLEEEEVREIGEDDGNFEEETRIDDDKSSLDKVRESTLELTGKKTEDYANASECDDDSQDLTSYLGLSEKIDKVRLPWERADRSKGRWSKAEDAEKTIPETELHRLRNVSLRMKERIKVRAGGVTQELVDKILEKWKVQEVVKLRFEGPPAFNMKRTHETLESRTGGVVIWRSGSSLVLYRGMTYKFPCVQQYTKLAESKLSTYDDGSVELKNASKTEVSQGTTAEKEFKGPSEDIMDMDDLNNLLDELGPRFIDWSGLEPLPVDADRLPSVVPGYTPPFRVLPHRVRPTLGNKGTTKYRRLARSSPPHFALGRNRELQGLARAMVKLWERNAIAKIAIKRGVLNTRNERMAEELKMLTGGTLLSRNKEYIVFYRGNDFLSPHVTEALSEREKLVESQQEEEEIARNRASMMFLSKAKTTKIPPVAGTLAETLAAKSRWGIEPSSEDLEKMKREHTMSKHTSLVRYLEKKLAQAQDKVNKAEKALRKVQEYLTPAELPSDLEFITDEERVLYRRMGLSMKGFLLVGRREVFDGTVENIHLHWKHRELVKIIVRGRNFLQVKHIAISLEAESGGLLVSVDKTTKGYAIVLYRGKNYQRPKIIRPKNLLTKRQALARSIELQRREALIHHIREVGKRIELLKSGLDEIESGKKGDEEIHSRLNDVYLSEDDFDEDEGEEAYLETYEDDDEGIPIVTPRRIYRRGTALSSNAGRE